MKNVKWGKEAGMSESRVEGQKGERQPRQKVETGNWKLEPNCWEAVQKAPRKAA
jgi:hypothetical protein